MKLFCLLSLLFSVAACSRMLERPAYTESEFFSKCIPEIDGRSLQDFKFSSKRAIGGSAAVASFKADQADIDPLLKSEITGMNTKSDIHEFRLFESAVATVPLEIRHAIPQNFVPDAGYIITRRGPDAKIVAQIRLFLRKIDGSKTQAVLIFFGD